MIGIRATRALASACLVLLAGIAAAAGAAETGATPGGPAGGESSVQFTIKAGETKSIGVMNHVNDDCTTASAGPVIQILQAPRHGAVGLGIAETAYRVNPDNPHSHCNGRRVPGVQMFYQPDPGFTGDDAVEIQFVGGGKVLLKVKVE